MGFTIVSELELEGRAVGQEASFEKGATFNFRSSHATKNTHYFFLSFSRRLRACPYESALHFAKGRKKKGVNPWEILT